MAGALGELAIGRGTIATISRGRKITGINGNRGSGSILGSEVVVIEYDKTFHANQLDLY
jgi:hypothetical protein